MILGNLWSQNCHSNKNGGGSYEQEKLESAGDKSQVKAQRKRRPPSEFVVDSKYWKVKALAHFHR
jgi:hypothetical protein